MQFHNDGAEVFVPDGSDAAAALARTTHLAVGAHPDDIAIMGFPAVCECYDDPERWLLGVTVTDGARSPRAGRYAAVGDAELSSVRRQEERRAAVVGRYTAAVLLDYRSADLIPAPAASLVDDLTALLETIRPTVVFTHNLADRHSTHVAVTLAVVEAIRRLEPDARPHRVYGGEVWGDLDWLVAADRVVFDVGRWTGLAGELLGVYESQIAAGKRYDSATLGRRAAHATFGDPRTVDATTGVAYGLDLTPLTIDPSIDAAVWLAAHVDRARDDAVARVQQVSRG